MAQVRAVEFSICQRILSRSPDQQPILDGG
ncbi:MAG: hypothetical protein QOJ42_2233, partial [Acidobacteriaceae bacterium]|nr:hypothetical protein [Acidobacteriaceae bacterium]